MKTLGLLYCVNNLNNFSLLVIGYYLDSGNNLCLSTHEQLVVSIRHQPDFEMISRSTFSFSS